MFLVRSVYFNLRNIIPKCGTFLPGHPVYMYILLFIEHNGVSENYKCRSVIYSRIQLTVIVIDGSFPLLLAGISQRNVTRKETPRIAFTPLLFILSQLPHHFDAKCNLGGFRLVFKGPQNRWNEGNK